MRPVWRESRVRWVTHLSISWSFVGLFAIGSLGNMAADLGAPLEKDDAWFATFNDTLGLALLAGIALALGRRYVSPKPYTRTLFDDAAVLMLLALLGAGGFLAEAGRYLEESTSGSAGMYSYVGYPLSQAFEPLGWNWGAVYDWLWWTHSMVALGLVVYIPYSKLLHIFTSPLTIAVNAGIVDSPNGAFGDVEREASASKA
jgi:nitrate reductase gamma subunit